MNINHALVMAERNRQKWAHVGNATDVYRRLASMLNDPEDPFDKPPHWLTPAVLESMGEAVTALSNDAHDYACQLEERLEDLSEKEAAQLARAEA